MNSKPTSGITPSTQTAQINESETQGNLKGQTVSQLKEPATFLQSAKSMIFTDPDKRINKSVYLRIVIDIGFLFAGALFTAFGAMMLMFLPPLGGTALAGGLLLLAFSIADLVITVKSKAPIAQNQ